jgi:AcrR family transcriptional regulator
MDPVIRDILDVALREFATHGLAGARIDAIAARTRTSKRMIYYHFGSKEGLYTAALDHAYRLVRGNAFDEERLHGQPPMAALDELVGHAFDSHCEHPDFVHLVMYENLQGAATVAKLPEIAQLNRRGLEHVAELMLRGQADGSMRADVSARDVYLLFVSQCFHFVSNRASVHAVLGGEDDDTARAQRRAAVIESVRRFVQETPA